ncbi:NAD-dependent epimerase/dehydratase family protein, partial [bacterium]|nr:NAD-dependent epimerase/dehydratase family protein [Candidatus Elulimicrobium humile]
MKIAVLGARGFVGSSLVKYLSNKHKVVPVLRTTIDLLDYHQVFDFLKKEKFDVIINAAAVMTDPNSFADTRNNLGIFMNFFNSPGMFKKFINLGSGAEF